MAKQFGRGYPTFDDWYREAEKKLKEGKIDSSYFKRIVEGHKRYPNASLSELRGHKGGTSKYSGKPRKKKGKSEECKKQLLELRHYFQSRIKEYKNLKHKFYGRGLYTAKATDEIVSEYNGKKVVDWEEVGVIEVCGGYFMPMYRNFDNCRDLELFIEGELDPFGNKRMSQYCNMFVFWVFDDKGRYIGGVKALKKRLGCDKVSLDKRKVCR